MKNLINYLFMVTCICMLVSCNESLQLENELAVAESKSASNHNGQVFYVEPDAGLDDTENIKQAFTNAKNAGPGSVVQLIA